MTAKPGLIAQCGGRKFVLSVVSVLAISVLALAGADALAFSAIAVIAAGYGGANAYIEGRHAAPRNKTRLKP